MEETIAVLGGGAWGTALAVSALRGGHRVKLWARDRALADEISQHRTNRRYLGEVRLPEGIAASDSLAETLRDASIVLSVVPAQATRSVLAEAAGDMPDGVPVVLCAKGIEQKTGKLVSQLAAETLPDTPLAALSGPSFAADVARGLPTAVTVASEDGDLAHDLAERLSAPAFRCYSTDDLIGVEAGGALKNVLAIAVGAAAGAELGASARAALVTRGFVELRRLGVALGGHADTLMGLSGLGDLILTCSSEKSRNFTYGATLGRGQSPEGLKLAEGVATANIAAELADRYDIDTPIIDATVSLLEGEHSVRELVASLMARPVKPEDHI
ncbi:NAD(P)H-dependent glycerol-3-phosphate dehydrogenase [Notoacmeibacter ruber]|uniref:Glycerol-3-phosphate dehydrogenase [NAD(P)+] n=1 Tax=Notoacmeibacter ruber TaxID=2670375 RepID=A0A3L7JFS3_9HYPH|nr:NAD(P)H-dependent glycerol-3-phosphate dehydrogenase [Notoacmeibacter ruber]RLQ89607.1 NAD(P)-dependent glycerol-3-phosphate dehydrogenase [Notoacmeibacter ruber]